MNQWNKHTFKKCKLKFIPPLKCLNYCQNVLQTFYQTIHGYQSSSEHELLDKGKYKTAKIELNIPFFVLLVRRRFTCVFWMLVGTNDCLGRIHFLSRGIRVRSWCARLSMVVWCTIPLRGKGLDLLGWCPVPLRGIILDLLGWCAISLRGVRLTLWGWRTVPLRGVNS